MQIAAQNADRRGRRDAACKRSGDRTRAGLQCIDHVPLVWLAKGSSTGAYHGPIGFSSLSVKEVKEGVPILSCLGFSKMFPLFIRNPSATRHRQTKQAGGKGFWPEHKAAP